MSKEYFKDLFRNIIIYTPNYKLEFYKIISSQYLFYFNQRNQLIKTDIISKIKYDSIKKLIQPIKTILFMFSTKIQWKQFFNLIKKIILETLLIIIL